MPMTIATTTKRIATMARGSDDDDDDDDEDRTPPFFVLLLALAGSSSAAAATGVLRCRSAAAIATVNTNPARDATATGSASALCDPSRRWRMRTLAGPVANKRDG